MLETLSPRNVLHKSFAPRVWMYIHPRDLKCLGATLALASPSGLTHLLPFSDETLANLTSLYADSSELDEEH